MSASFDHPTAANSMRRSTRSSETPPSMADQLPSIQFGFDGLRAHMTQFSSKFDGFVERNRKQVLEERNRFHLNLTELRGTFMYHTRCLP